MKAQSKWNAALRVGQTPDALVDIALALNRAGITETAILSTHAFYAYAMVARRRILPWAVQACGLPMGCGRDSEPLLLLAREPDTVVRALRLSLWAKSVQARETSFGAIVLRLGYRIEIIALPPKHTETAPRHTAGFHARVADVLVEGLEERGGRFPVTTAPLVSSRGAIARVAVIDTRAQEAISHCRLAASGTADSGTHQMRHKLIEQFGPLPED